jgi:transaldolase
MSLFVDTADLAEAEEAAGYGFVVGATTNPKLLAKAGHKDPVAALRDLCPLFSGTVFYQLLHHDLEGMRSEIEQVKGIAPNLGLKIPCTLAGLQMSDEVNDRMVVAMTAVFNPSQAYMSGEAGARYIIPYVNRISRYTGDGPAVIAQMNEVLLYSETEILAAGIKSPKEATDTILAGAAHLSLPLSVIQAMAQDQLSDQAIGEFDAVAAEQWG